jgi:hypothetical protein
MLPVTLDGSPGTPGAGGFSLSTQVFINDLSLYLQVFLVDGGATKGVSMSNGLEIDFP